MAEKVFMLNQPLLQPFICVGVILHVNDGHCIWGKEVGVTTL